MAAALPDDSRPGSGEPIATGDLGGIDEERTALPVLSTWPRLYAFVLIVFVVCVLALLWLTRAYS